VLFILIPLLLYFNNISFHILIKNNMTMVKEFPYKIFDLPYFFVYSRNLPYSEITSANMSWYQVAVLVE
jgi:hypothetical protein